MPLSSNSRYHELAITGMSCAACAARIERVLKRLPGVEANVNIATAKAAVTLNDASVSVSEIVQAIEKAGFGALSAQDNTYRQASAQREYSPRVYLELAIALLLSIPLLLQMIGMLTPWHFEWPGVVQWGLATPIQFWCARHLYANAWRALRGGSANMDVLVTLGTSIAYGFSTLVLWLSIDSPLYFETSAMIITLILLGRVMESRARQRAGAAIHALLALRPSQAHVERNGQLVDVAVDQLRQSEVIIVRPGEKIPADGLIVSGIAELDEALLTGESRRICKTEGDPVFAATLNAEGVLRVRITQVGDDTRLAQIIRLVEQAQGSKAYAQRLADRVAAVFVPIVMLIAVLTFLLNWGYGGQPFTALMSSVAVLVIACPCALGLATPTAIMVGTGRGAQVGLLFRHAQALEQIRHIQTLVIDKTGTLTLGQPQVVAILTAPDTNAEALLKTAAGIEQYAEHPLARAIVRYAKQQHIEPPAMTALQSYPGQGVTGQSGLEPVVLGSLAFVRSYVAPETNAFSATSGAWVQQHEQQGRMVVAVARGSSLLGYLALSDQLRPGAQRLITRLHRQRIHVVMLTGDTARVAARVAQEVGIDEVMAGVLPEEKAATIDAIKRHGRRVAMLGDGINDAPALATADVGIAMGAGADVSLEAADIVLTHDRLNGVMEALSLSKATLRRIHQNLFFAFFYNGLGIPLAALGLLNPVIAGAAMAMSSVSVVINSLLLQRWQPPSP